jgi:hypothetical protein
MFSIALYPYRNQRLPTRPTLLDNFNFMKILLEMADELALA